MRLPRGWRKLHQGKDYVNYTNGNLGLRIEFSKVRRPGIQHIVVVGHVEGYGRDLVFVPHDVAWAGPSKAQAEKVAVRLMRFEQL